MLSKGYIWKMHESRKGHVRGRRLGDLLLGVRKGLMVGQGSEEESKINKRNKAKKNQSRKSKGSSSMRL